jgi:hypothetical protein
MSDQDLRDALIRLAAKWDDMDTPGLALPENQEWAKGVDCGYGVAASELRDLLAAHPVEPTEVQITAEMVERGAKAIYVHDGGDLEVWPQEFQQVQDELRSDVRVALKAALEPKGGAS